MKSVLVWALGTHVGSACPSQSWMPRSALPSPLFVCNVLVEFIYCFGALYLASLDPACDVPRRKNGFQMQRKMKKETNGTTMVVYGSQHSNQEEEASKQ